MTIFGVKAIDFIPTYSAFEPYTSAFIEVKGILYVGVHMKKPIGKFPCTLSKVLAGTMKNLRRDAWNTERNLEKLLPCKFFKVEKFAKTQREFSCKHG